MHRILLAATLLAVAAPYANAADGAVTISNFTFSPQVLTVPAGTRVVWTNRDDSPHLVAATPPDKWRSPPLDTDESYAYRFTTRGTFHYFCAVHPMMTGTIVVK
jgi:plastocyanin